MDWTFGPLDVLLLGLGLVLISTGNLAMFADRLAAVAGIKLRGVTDPRRLSLFVGLWLFGLGLAAAFFPVGIRLIGPQYGWGLLALAVLGVLRLVTGSRRFLRRDQEVRQGEDEATPQ